MFLRHPKRQAHNTPQVGDIVLIKENLPSRRWKTGVIHELIKGRDQVVQSAKVFTSPKTYLHRALNLLYPIECPESQLIAMKQLIKLSLLEVILMLVLCLVSVMKIVIFYLIRGT